ncbi:MAG TPA: response regulator [Aggregatilinea sp.]|jgi:CheY-like chemotaxis protein|uniref:response regulator n=1 Tax=Aggregatilinea sp. TaxID=2806333 RepID=UPI002C48F859|nr:response regulator [Aggregatilinea sp.]HML21147.1 response regulator [Aggregatilinea sp.]
MNKQAMVIEDDYDASVIFAKALEVLGLEVQVSHDGAEALELLADVVPDVIVLDLHLPNVVGTQILQQIRDDERLMDTRVIVATADPRMADSIKPQADLVLLKPTTFSQVRDLASKLLSVPRSQSKRQEAFDR